MDALDAHSHYNCGAANCTDTSHSHSEVTTWTEVSNADGLAAMASGGSYYLSDSISLTSTVTISGTVNLCLNGKTVSAAGGYFNVASGGTLNLCSCSTGGAIKRTTGGEDTPLIYARSGATANLYNVTLDGGADWTGTEDNVLLRGTTNSGIESSKPLIDAGEQKIKGGSITLNGGVVLQNNCCNEAGLGGAITLGEFGTLVINGATICNNAKTAGQAGAIKAYARAEITLNNGEIYGNSAKSHGGAIQIFGNDNSNEFTDNDVYARLRMKGGMIRNNKAGGVGGGIAVSDYSEFIMDGGAIKDNATTDYQNRGGGVGFADANTYMSVYGNVVITDNTANDAANNLYIGTNTCNKVLVGKMSSDTPIGVTMADGSGTFTLGWRTYMGSVTDYGAYFTSDRSGFRIAKNTSDELELQAVVSGVSLNKTSTTLTVGNTETLTATVAPSNATNKAVTWASSNTDVATVDNDGKVAAVAAGSATITVTTTDGGYSATCVVTVREAENPITYTVTVTSEGNGTASASPTSGAEGTEITLTVTPASGYHFKEWEVLSGGVTVSDNKFTIDTADVEIKAIFEADAPNTYVVTYLPGANGIGAQSTATKTHGVDLTLEGAIFTRTGYTQTGWATTDGGAKAYDLNATYSEDAPITLYPVWTANTNTAYTVEHWQQNVEQTGYVKVDTDNKTGTTDTDTEAAAKTYTGFTEQNFSQTTIAPDGSTVVVIKYDRNTYDVTYADTSAYLSNVIFEDVVYGAKAPTYTNSTDRTGYTFGGWYKEPDCINAWDFDVDTVSGSTTLYAKWTINSHKLTWSNGDGGEYEQTLDYGTTIEVPANDLFNDTMRKAGHTLIGWVNDSGYEIGDTMPDQELTFTAQYTAHTYTVRFDANGGSGSMADMNFTYGESKELTDNAFTKADMHFIGWKDDSGRSYNNGDSVGNLTTENNGVVVLYAQWADKPAQTITFDTSDCYATYGDGTLDARIATAAGAITYSSNDETVATVDENGVVTVLNAGEVVITATAAETDEYASGSTSYKLIVAPKTLTITAEDKEAYVYSRQPELTYSVDGLVDGDELKTVPTLNTDADMNKIGTYTITASGADAGSNYSITYVDGTLTVKMFYVPIITPTYPPVVDAGDNGDVSVSPKNPEKGDTVIITPDPNEGYEVDEVIVTDMNGNSVEIIDNGDGTYSFIQPNGKVNIEVTFKEIEKVCPCDSTCPMYPYTDLDASLWYHDGIHYCIEHGLMQGIGNDQFAPSATTTRAMIVTILWRLEGSPVVNYAMDFEDVAAEQWYTEAIRWAASEKIVEGYGNGKFGTSDAITREQMVTIMFRYAKYKGYDVSVGENTNILSYDDAFDVAEYAIPAMQWACGSGMIQGIADGSTMNLAPQGNATRAQAASILQRFVENVAVED